MPFKRTEDEVVAHVPLDIPVTITVTEAKGISATIDLAERLAAHGYHVNPHLPARQIGSEAELVDIVNRMLANGIDRAFIVAGDAKEPAGDYDSALKLIQALDHMGRPLSDIGVSGYPEGHAHISDADLDTALRTKTPYAARIVTQMCFDATTIARWADATAQRGITVPVIVGLPGPVSRQKLVRIAGGIGLGQSARFLQKQQGLLRKFLTPGGFTPDGLLRKLAALPTASAGNIQGLRIFTFNEIAGTEEWRRNLAASLPGALGEPCPPAQRVSAQ
ncbi:5,10-methylenetetrahydrofolate reductase [Amycolatopsis sp. RM579]|uniref:Methylenetetrahydrofolate reductase n=2 Tax=Amycolatopsis pithecellobii TaxID=664692 RepID=A0A6N7YPD2_9PSEU|nr:5,10-methylenetetrahydrofolate reductase [Amycolatopsis pithecellobii]